MTEQESLLRTSLLTRIKTRMAILKYVSSNFTDPPDLDISTIDDLKYIDNFLKEICLKLFRVNK